MFCVYGVVGSSFFFLFGDMRCSSASNVCVSFLKSSLSGGFAAVHTVILVMFDVLSWFSTKSLISFTPFGSRL